MKHPFISHNKVRMHDTDMAGILYFPRIYRFAHDALEDFLEAEGYNFDYIFKKNNFVFVIAHSEANYIVPLHVGDQLEIQLSVESIGTSSFTFHYNIYRITPENKELAGNAKTVHVTLDTDRKKIPIPDKFKIHLKKYFLDEI